MKNILFLFFLFIMLTACQSKNITPGETEPIATAESVVDTTEPSLFNHNGEALRVLEQEELALGIPILPEEDYYVYINEEIMAFANSHNLHLQRLDTGIPYLNYEFYAIEYIEPNTFRQVTLNYDEYEILFSAFKQHLLDSMERNAIEHGTNFFTHPSNTIIGLFCKNTFLYPHSSETKEVTVGSFQVDLMSYYYQDIDDNYIIMDDFDPEPWNKFLPIH